MFMKRISTRQYFCILVRAFNYYVWALPRSKPYHIVCCWSFPFSSGTRLWWSCFADKASAPFEPCKSECVSHAKWRTVVLYGQSNIVLGCLHCTWWYGANRGICQMQSGVMEGRDTARRIKNKGEDRGRNSLSRAWISTEHQLQGDKDQNRHIHAYTYQLKSPLVIVL